MVYQPATGARDLLPLDVAQKEWIEERLQQVFHRWGYHRIITSTVERMDTLMAGEAIQRQMVIQLQNGQNEALGLRPELTASIARAVVTHMVGTSYPHRLYYNANIFRSHQESHRNRQQEYYQSGVELLGAGGLLANAEVLFLLRDCLAALDLQEWCLVLGEAGITRSLLDTFPLNLQSKVRQAIAHLDRVTIDHLPVDESLRELARTIMDLRGNSTFVLEKLSSLLTDTNQQVKVQNLKSLVELLESDGKFPLILDLSLIQTIDYYTGIVFEVVSANNGQARVLGLGGRYDDLLGLYHPQGEDIPGIGFVFNFDDLYQILLSAAKLPRDIPSTNWLVVPQDQSANAAVFAYAQEIRGSVDLTRVEIYLEGGSIEQVRQYAIAHSIPQIAWIGADGLPTIELV